MFVTVSARVLILRHFRKRRPSILKFRASSTLIPQLVSATNQSHRGNQNLFKKMHKQRVLKQHFFVFSFVIDHPIRSRLDHPNWYTLFGRSNDDAFVQDRAFIVQYLYIYSRYSVIRETTDNRATRLRINRKHGVEFCFFARPLKIR